MTFIDKPKKNNKFIMDKMFNIIFFLLLAVLAFPKTTHAYLDPGTGSFIIQIILSVVLGGIFAFKMFFAKIKQTIKKIFSKNKKNDKSDK